VSRLTKRRRLSLGLVLALGASAGCNAILDNGYGVDDTLATSPDGSSGGDALVEDGNAGGDGGPGTDGMIIGDGSMTDARLPDGAVCLNGVCPTVVANVVGPQRIDPSVTGVYWASNAGIGRVDFNGSNVKTFPVTQAVGATLKRGIATDAAGTAAYFTMPGSGKGAAKCSADLSNCTATFVGSAGEASSIAVAGTYVYLGIFDSGSGVAGGIFRYNGSLAEAYTMMTDKVLDLQIVGSTTYFRTATAIRANTLTTAPASVLNLNMELPTTFVINGTSVFVGTTAKHIQTCAMMLPTACMGNVVQITSTPPTAITADATRLYWVEEQAGTVHRCDIADCSNTDTLLADGQASPNAIALSRDGATIYWANYVNAAGAGGAVMKLPK
jgi:hypothetical protein